VELSSDSEEFESAKQIGIEAGLRESMITMILKSPVADIPVPVLFFVNIARLNNGDIKTQVASVVPMENAPKTYREKLTKMDKTIGSTIHKYAMKRYKKAQVIITVG
jgi:hypothetical protein